PFAAYEWDLVLDGPITFVGSTPDKPAGLTICSTPTTAGVPNEYYAGCLTTGGEINYIGRTDVVTLQCSGAGSGQLRLKKQSEGGPFGTDLLNAQAQPVTGDVGPAIQVTCS